MNFNSEIPLPAQAIIGTFEGGDGCEFAGDIEALELSGLVICGAMLDESHGKFSVAMPGKPYAKPDGSQAWCKVLDFRDRETSDKFQRTITPIAIAALERMREAS